MVLFHRFPVGFALLAGCLLLGQSVFAGQDGVANAMVPGNEQKNVSSVPLFVSDHPVFLELLNTYLSDLSREKPDQRIRLSLQSRPEILNLLKTGEFSVLITEISPAEIVKTVGLRAEIGCMEPFAVSGKFFAVNPDNKLSDMSSEDINGILSGRIRNWNTKEPDKTPVHIFSTSPLSKLEFQDAIHTEKDHQQTNVKPSRPYVYEFEDNHLMQEQMQSDLLAFAVFELTDFNRPGIKFLKVDGIAPTISNVIQGRYPFGKRFYLYHNLLHPCSIEYLKGREFAGKMLKRGILPLTQRKDTEKKKAEQK